ncbi:MAG: hypothetical protein R2717_02605 [Schumannella sp.]|nr:hypothetical protein [Microbacteriaceae bacterium]
MPSPRAQGVFALCAVVLAAISFAGVDVSLADSGTCAAGDCSVGLPAFAIVCAVVGTLALLASIPPAVAWFVSAIHHSQHDAETEHPGMAALRPATVRSYEEDDA